VPILFFFNNFVVFDLPRFERNVITINIYPLPIMCSKTLIVSALCVTAIAASASPVDDTDHNEPSKNIWAVLVAGSHKWLRYRHQVIRRYNFHGFVSLILGYRRIFETRFTFDALCKRLISFGKISRRFTFA